MFQPTPLRRAQPGLAEPPLRRLRLRAALLVAEARDRDVVAVDQAVVHRVDHVRRARQLRDPLDDGTGAARAAISDDRSIALIGGSLGLHRFYLHGWRDVWGWLHPLPTLLGSGEFSEVFLEKATIGHPQFCPDDDDLILYAGPMTETVLMGNLAIRSYMLRRDAGDNKTEFYGRRKLLWDGEKMKITNFEAANQFVGREYRKGWEV